MSSSENSISWQAHREAEVLADTTLLNELDAYLDQKPTKEQRSAAYFIIGKIGENCCDEECASRLIKYASKETDKYVLASLLDPKCSISSSVRTRTFRAGCNPGGQTTKMPAVEHWDTLQLVGDPKNSALWVAPNIPRANSNKMF